MRRVWLKFMMALVAGVFLTGMGLKPAATEAPRISKEELKGRLGSSGLAVIDVRVAKDWEGSDRKIAEAVREDPAAPEMWEEKYPKGTTLVLYCA
jgi:rhodanese-related sulfurtransferase